MDLVKPMRKLLLSIIFFAFSGEERATELETKIDFSVSDAAPQTNAATFSAGLGYDHKAVSLSCRFCTVKVTSGPKSLALHYASQHRDKLLACTECGYLSLSKSSLAKHKKMHKGIQYRCSECDYAATTAFRLKQHKASKHEGI